MIQSKHVRLHSYLFDVWNINILENEMSWSAWLLYPALLSNILKINYLTHVITTGVNKQTISYNFLKRTIFITIKIGEDNEKRISHLLSINWFSKRLFVRRTRFLSRSSPFHYFACSKYISSVNDMAFLITFSCLISWTERSIILRPMRFSTLVDVMYGIE